MVAGLFARLTCNGFQIPMSEGQRLEVALRQHSGSSLMDIPGHQEENSQRAHYSSFPRALPTLWASISSAPVLARRARGLAIGASHWCPRVFTISTTQLPGQATRHPETRPPINKEIWDQGGH